MIVDSSSRVMWLLNEGPAQTFEFRMLKEIGIEEIFIPNYEAPETGECSTSITDAKASTLSLPAEDLAILNSQNWRGQPSQIAWDIANRHFDACFFSLRTPESFTYLTSRFQGALLWRVYGRSQGSSHSDLLAHLTQQQGERVIQRIGNRFWFAQAYDHLHLSESPVIARRRLDLPIGLINTEVCGGWSGNDARVYFQCPQDGPDTAGMPMYLEFMKFLGDLPHAVFGPQEIDLGTDPTPGDFSNDGHGNNILQFRVMFHNSPERDQFDHQLFFAIRAGMPLIFMAGGLLDHIGGLTLPGRCESYQEARRKIKRLLAGDITFQEEVRQSQQLFLHSMDFEDQIQKWQASFRHVRSQLDDQRRERLERNLLQSKRKKRVAVIVAVGYRGGSLRGAKLLAQALQLGAAQCGDAVDLVLVHLDDPQIYSKADFKDLPHGIKTRTFKWRKLKADAATRAMRYAGLRDWKPSADEYLVVDDGIKQLEDCDLWLVVSDRITAPLLPLRPVVHMVYDYLQRYVPILPKGADQPFINAARVAAQVWTTTEFTRQDALQYAGVLPNRVVKLPMLAPMFRPRKVRSLSALPPYFVWTTNSAPHKNIEHALRALQFYYDEFDGTLHCHVTGVNTEKLLDAPTESLKKTMAWVRAHERLQSSLRWHGELLDDDYQRLLQGATFLWNATRIDNGTFSAVEAASLGVPTLSSDYPAMREMNAQFALNLAWMDATDPLSMAQALKDMEDRHLEHRNSLPSAELLATQSVERLAPSYWQAAVKFL